MNLTIRKYSHIKQIEKQWRQIEKSNDDLSPFQYFEYNQVLEKLFWFHRLKEILSWVQIKYEYYLIEYEGEPIIIVPLVKDLRKNNGKWQKEYHILGKCQSGVLDFVYKNIEQSVFNEAIWLLRQNINNPLCITSIRNTSKLYQYAVDNGIVPQYKSNYVTIQFGDEFDIYNKSLSKSTRQNIRTAYNRLGIANKSYSLKTYCDDDDIKKLMDVYISRVAKKYHKRNNFVTRFIYKHLQYYFVSFRKCSNAKYFVLMIDNEVAAFMAGYVNMVGNYFVVPRLAICDEYNFYSPGMLLLNETIKYMISDTGIRELDLSLGEEKYKYSMGGVKYTGYQCVM